MGDKHYVVLYTSQKSKKAKTWHDGTLRLPLNGSKAVLYDDKKSKLDSIHIRADEVVPGEQLESDRYFILVEELIKSAPASADNSVNCAASTSVKSNTLPVPANKRPLRTGLKRKNTGFVPPRMVKQPRQDTCENITANDDSFESSNPTSTWSSQNSLKQDRLPSPHRQDIFSLYAKNKDRVSSFTEASPELDSNLLPSYHGNLHLNSHNQEAVVKSPWSTYGNVKLKSKQTNKSTDSGGSSQSDISNESSQTSFCSNSEQNSAISVNRYDEIKPELENKHENYQCTDISVRELTENTNQAQSKRSASQIMALLKPRAVKKEVLRSASPQSSPSVQSDIICENIESETRGCISSNKRLSIKSSDDIFEDHTELSPFDQASNNGSSIQITNHKVMNCEPFAVPEKISVQNLRHWEENKHENTDDLNLLGFVKSENCDIKDGLPKTTVIYGNETKSGLEINKREEVLEINNEKEKKIEMNKEEEKVEINKREEETGIEKEMNEQEKEENSDESQDDDNDYDDDDVGDPYFQISFSPLSQVTDSDDENTIENSSTMVKKNNNLSMVSSQSVNNCETESDKELVFDEMSEQCDEQQHTDFIVNETNSTEVQNNKEICLDTESNFRKNPKSRNGVQVNNRVSYNYLESLNFSQDSLRAQSLNSQDNYDRISYPQPAKYIKLEQNYEDRNKISTFVDKTTTNTLQHSDSSLPFGDVEYVSDSQSSQISLEQTPLITENQANHKSGLQIPFSKFSKFKHLNDSAQKSCDNEIESTGNDNSNLTTEFDSQNISENLKQTNEKTKVQLSVEKVSKPLLSECIEKKNCDTDDSRFFKDGNQSGDLYMNETTGKLEIQDTSYDFEDPEVQECFSGKTSTCSSDFSAIIPYQEKNKCMTNIGDHENNASQSVPNCESDFSNTDRSDLLPRDRFIQRFRDISQSDTPKTTNSSEDERSALKRNFRTHVTDVKKDYKKQPSSFHCLPHPSEVFGVTDKHKVEPAVNKEDLSSVVNKKLDSYRIRGSISGCVAKRTSNDPDYLSHSFSRNTSDPYLLSSQNACRNTSSDPYLLSLQSACGNTSTDPYFLSSQATSRNTNVKNCVSHFFKNVPSPPAVVKSPHQWTESYDDTSMYIDWNDGKPRLRDIEHLNSGTDKQTSGSPFQFVPELKTCIESPEQCQEVPHDEERVFLNYPSKKESTGNDDCVPEHGHSDNTITSITKEHNRHEQDHITPFSKELQNRSNWSEKLGYFHKSYGNDSFCDKKDMSKFNSQTKTFDNNKTVFAGFNQNIADKFSPNYTETNFKKNNDHDKHSYNNTKHDSRSRKALKSKPFDDPITHTSYKSYHFSPTKTSLNEQSTYTRHGDKTNEKNEYFDTSLNLSLEISTTQLDDEPCKIDNANKNGSCNDVSFQKSTVHMLRAPISNQDIPGNIYEHSTRMNHFNKSDCSHESTVSNSVSQKSPFSLNTSLEENLCNEINFTDSTDFDGSDKDAYDNRHQHKFQFFKPSSNRFLSNNMSGDKSFGNIYNNDTVLQVSAGNHGNKVGNVTSKWGKYLAMDEEDNDEDFDSMLDQSLDIGTPKLNPSLEPLKEVGEYVNSNDSNFRKSAIDLLRAPTLSNEEVSVSKNVKTTVRHGTKYIDDLFDKGDDISKPIEYSKFCGNSVSDEKFMPQSVMSGTETASPDGTVKEKTFSTQRIGCEKSRQFKSPLMKKPTYETQKLGNFVSPVTQEHKYGTEKESAFPSPILDEPEYETQKGRKFASPVIQDCSHLLASSKRNLAGELQFACQDEVERNPVPSRLVKIPVCFPSVSVYKNVLTAVLKEHLNIILFELSKQYHHTLAKIDTSGYGLQNKEKKDVSGKSSNPVCNCGAPSKIIQVKKEGANKGRFFYACNAARNVQCKFFQWADQSGGNNTKGKTFDSKISLNSSDSITTFFRSQHVTLYTDCTFLKKNVENIMHHFKKNVPEWVKKRSGISGNMDKKKMYVQLSKKDPSSMFAKDDLWIISHQLHFEPSSTFLARSTYYGPNSSNEVEIEPMAGFSASNWSNQSKCHCILMGNISSELSYLQNIQENINPVSLPVLPSLLNRQNDIDVPQKSSNMKGFKAPQQQVSKNNLHAPDNLIIDLAQDFIIRYHLNEDQSAAIKRVAIMFSKERQLDSDPILLIHGVFGAGKSYLLSVIVLFLVKVFELNASYTPGVPFDWKILISSTTNVAVDRILNGLLQLDFEDFVRVGSIKKIAKPVLPYSVHATGTDSQELKDLQEMLRSGDATPSEKHHIRQSIEKHRLGENKKKLSKVKVVGVTCAASAFSCLDNLRFPVVLIDESSQMTEPSSLLPIAKFGCNKLLLVGDPKQLDPAIQGSEATHDQGLEQTLFDRLTKLGYEPTVLRTQYRCHPVISNIANTLFYGGCLINGISQEDRLPLVNEFPTLCFYDVSCGKDCSDSAGSYYNQEEADYVVYLIQVLICSGVEPCNIGVITLYKSQMYKIITTLGLTSSGMHKEVKSILVSTVDAFQGGERDVIILSCVRTNNVGFIDNEKRTNVALTRAKHHLLIVGHLNNLSKNNLWSSVIQQCKDFPGGIENSNHTRQKLQHIIDNASQDGTTDLNDTESTTSKKKVKKTSRKNKTSTSSVLQDSSSPPMSLSGSGTQQTERFDSEDMFSCSSEKEVASSNTCKIKKKRKPKVIDPSLLDSDKENSEDEDFQKFC